jgi:hypothetical protein
MGALVGFNSLYSLCAGCWSFGRSYFGFPVAVTCFIDYEVKVVALSAPSLGGGSSLGKDRTSRLVAIQACGL